jgi:Amt family ammonium transporter
MKHFHSKFLIAAFMLYSYPSCASEELSVVDNGFILMSAMLVLLMSIPGIGLFYGGLTRSKNILSTIEQCLAVFSIAILLWFILGYSIAFGSTEGFLGSFIGDFKNVFLYSIDLNRVSGTLSEFTFVIFQGAFCAISACLIVGATVERIRFSALLISISIWIIFSYAPLCHQVWGGGFIDSVFNAYDFAGGTVVHINAAVCGLIGARLVGKRHDLGKVSMLPHNLSLTYIGACLLWIGWLGFNAGSELSADGVSALAFINTVICPAAAALTWMFAEWIIFKKPSTLGTASGVIAGLVGITPACAFVSPIGAFVIGIACGLTCLWGVHGFKRRTKVDDALDVFGIHGIGAIVGGILTGIFCSPALGGTGFKGAYASISGQVYGQFMSIIVTLVWSGIISYLAFKLADLLVGLRVHADEESEGLDLSSHGERSYSI